MYQIGEHIMYKILVSVWWKRSESQVFLRIKTRNIIRCVRWMRRAMHGSMFPSILISLCGISLQKKKPVFI